MLQKLILSEISSMKNIEAMVLAQGAGFPSGKHFPNGRKLYSFLPRFNHNENCTKYLIFILTVTWFTLEIKSVQVPFYL